SVVSGVLDPAWANITDPDALAVAKLTVGPLASKFMLCDKARPPQLDGKLDDACWKNAAVYSDFHKLGTGKPAEFRTEVRASHDGERLYVAVRCHQDTNVLLAWTHGRDDRVWREDGVEFLINRLSDTTKEQRCQIILNTKGNIWDYYNGDQKWDGDIKTGIAIEPTFYTIEASLPLKDIGITPGKERFIRFNVSRNVYARKELRIGEEKEISGWYPSDDNLNPKSRGWLVLNP
ncbi:MAG: hypothetical protein FJ278_22600, partial [Planctomycetes bacterium]|nr:hypothetical protein [Planctomycetota bacterium]